MHTDQYTIKLRSLSEGDHEYDWTLDDAFFARLSEGAIHGGEVFVDLDLRRTGEVFSLHLYYEGYVTTTCDRCLEPVDLDLEDERELVVKFGHNPDESTDEILIVDEHNGVLDLEWLLYEDVMLALPLQHMHPEGECSAEMMALYDAVATDQVRDPEDDSLGIERDEEGIDERWAALKQLR